jgi:hypothetical protein
VNDRHAPAPEELQVCSVSKVHKLYFRRTKTAGGSIQLPSQRALRALNVGALGQKVLAAVVPNGTGGSLQGAKTRGVIARLNDERSFGTCQFSREDLRIGARICGREAQSRTETRSSFRYQDGATVWYAL